MALSEFNPINPIVGRARKAVQLLLKVTEKEETKREKTRKFLLSILKDENADDDLKLDICDHLIHEQTELETDVEEILMSLISKSLISKEPKLDEPSHNIELNEHDPRNIAKKMNSKEIAAGLSSVTFFDQTFPPWKM